MPFIPHTEEDIQSMLNTVGVRSLDALFDEIPGHLRSRALDQIPPGITEMEMARWMRERAQQDKTELCFIGAGAYEHHIPAVVWDIASRGEFMTAYTPYQAEASQGTLQLLYEYQTMMANLMGMEVSNASMYDGASALAEAILMAARAHKKADAKRVLLLGALHPHYRQVVQAIVCHQAIEWVEVPFDPKTGHVAVSELASYAQDPVLAVVIQQPNFFGVLEEVDELTDWAHQHDAFVIASVNPTAMALLKEPGQWGTQGRGADIVCGEGQPLGVPLAFGGPYFGFLCCKQVYVRHMPGRIIGRTVDREGKPGFTLTLQAREQHIRRSKATSNICTNQGLLVTAATIYLSLLGFDGLQRVAMQSYSNTERLVQLLTAIPGVEVVFQRPHFHEVVLRLPQPAHQVLSQLAAQGIQGGLALGPYYPGFENMLLVCITETKTQTDLQHFAKILQTILNSILSLQPQPQEISL